MATYSLPDEPTPGPLARIAVAPNVPLVAFMLGGSIAGLSWLALNSFAIGSATRRRELVIAVSGLVFSAAWIAVLVWLLSEHIVPMGAGRYLGLVALAGRLGAAYWVFLLQERSFELYQYFGGTTVKRAWIGIVAIFALRLWLLQTLPAELLLLVLV